MDEASAAVVTNNLTGGAHFVENKSPTTSTFAVTSGELKINLEPTTLSGSSSYTAQGGFLLVLRT